MDNFKTIYKMLKKLEENMDEDNFDFNTINHEAMEISQMRWNRILKMMIDNGFIDGVRIVEADGQPFLGVKAYDPHITLDGLHYLEENSAMAKIAKALKGIKDIVPTI
jgi:hypothetical protein